MDTNTAATAAKFYRLAAIHFEAANENRNGRGSYYLKLAQGELARARAAE